MIDDASMSGALRVFSALEVTLVPFLLGFVVSALVTRLAIAVARRARVVAVADGRSLHSGEVPRLGGVGPAFAILAGGLLLSFAPRFEAAFVHMLVPPYFRHVVLLGGAAALLCGLADDLFSLDPVSKLMFQVCVAAMAAPLALPFAEFLVVLLRRGADDRWLTIAQSLLPCVAWVVVMMNVTNFMDGADGQAALFVAIQAAALVGYLFVAPGRTGSTEISLIAPFLTCFALLVTGAAVGFLLYNAPPAMTFLGDGGSHLLGYLLAVLSLLVWTSSFASAGYVNVGAMIVVASGFAVSFGPWLFDVFLTLARRALRRQPLWRAHREHLYQRLALAGWSHRALFALHGPYYAWNALMGLAILLPTTSPTVRAAAMVLGPVSWFAYWRFVLAAEWRAGVRAAAAPVATPDSR